MAVQAIVAAVFSCSCLGGRKERNGSSLIPDGGESDAEVLFENGEPTYYGSSRPRSLISNRLPYNPFAQKAPLSTLELKRIRRDNAEYPPAPSKLEINGNFVEIDLKDTMDKKYDEFNESYTTYDESHYGFSSETSPLTRASLPSHKLSPSMSGEIDIGKVLLSEANATNPTPAGGNENQGTKSYFPVTSPADDLKKRMQAMKPESLTISPAEKSPMLSGHLTRDGSVKSNSSGLSRSSHAKKERPLSLLSKASIASKASKSSDGTGSSIKRKPVGSGLGKTNASDSLLPMQHNA